MKLLSEHLAEGSVAVVVEAGAEKLRYVVGRAVAVNHRGETVVVDFQEIYAEAAAAFGTEPTRAQY